MAGFCKRCGDIIRGAETRCKCGGSSASSQVSRALFEPTKPDRWLKTYGEKRNSISNNTRAQTTQPSEVIQLPKSSAPVPITANQSTPNRKSLTAQDMNITSIPLRIVTPPTPLKEPQPSTPSDPTPKRGLSVKSSARAHVRSLTANIPDSIDLSAAEEEVLTNVFGSVLDPNETRGRCGACSEVFKREGKIYPDPRRDDLSSGDWAGVFYCRNCYIKLFSRGNCTACEKVVVGDEGFIQLGKGGSRGFWHKKCFKCVHCSIDISASPSVNLGGDPCCDECFDRPTRKSATSMVTDIPDLRDKPNIKRTMDSPATKALRPAVEELRSKLQKAGIEKVPTPAPKLSASRSMSPVTHNRLQPTSPLPTSASTGTITRNQLQPTRPLSISPTPLVTHNQFTRPRPLSTSASASIANDVHRRTPRPLTTSFSANTMASDRSSPSLPRSSSPLKSSVPLYPLKPTRPLSIRSLASPMKPRQSSATMTDKNASIPNIKSSTRALPLSPSTNPMCTKCSLPLFASHAPGATTLATLPTTGETFHLECLRCDGCDGGFEEGKYVLYDDLKLCERCVEIKEVQAAELRLKELREKIGHLQPSFPVVGGALIAAKKVSSSPFLSTSESCIGTGGGGGGIGRRLGGQSVCPGCLKPGTIQETKIGPMNQRWHTRCLKCERCGKALDSGAKTFQSSGKVGCRDCLDKDRVGARRFGYY
ncbi:uncharacterized protein MELLADRAFT_114990 [Melampsora larici-populina 98AG31]|uniref:LIM zinc-binding domain-containing protein n=1 Tax=Melampsora larici-populina (strain 98AG31 / pathotype 3-4-7) TaxID=747676 RepID=F4R644_MELLP|nr:uncharacterized protein MELLADRAFT_114990 [Melampsora larici-populina 98AG31]EGG12533.1 hypothetical protein MELLADRAFT_114990 [Melampsora larici-populina 98AG31]